MPALAPAKLPTVDFTLLHPPLPSPRVDNPQLLAPFGYNQGTDWPHYARTDTDDGPYLRWLQPMEADLARQVEYDMDEQDQLWLDALNRDRKRDGLALISYEVFEIIMDKIEKEWFDLTRNVPKRTNALPSEDSKCAICDDGECENANAIVFCDGCNLAVHQDCYGVPYIPEGQWLCRKCTVSPDKPVACVLCPRPYGAFKQTTTGQWAHLLCAIWIPDTSVSNTVYMEPVDGIEHIPKSRWKLVCYLCKKRVGACIQCANRSCYTAFHVTCAREAGLSLKMRQGTAASGELRAYCDRHGETTGPRAAGAGAGAAGGPNRTGASTPAAGGAGSVSQNALAKGSGSSSLLKLTVKLPSGAAADASSSAASSAPAAAAAAGAAASVPAPTADAKSARAHNKTSFARSPPVVPAKLAERITAYLARVKLAHKKDVVNAVCRYWSLKREARRGAPLLKRIHLEPWTASATTRQQSEADKAHKLALLRLVRNDLEKVRMLTELVRKRERKKLERANALRAAVEGVVFPLEARMRDTLEAIRALDKQHYFARPVDRQAVPDYYDLIHFPMDWETMGAKLARHEYLSGGDFTGDVRLVINNARRYNASSSPVHKAAVRLLALVEPRLAALDAPDDNDDDDDSAAATPLLPPGMVGEVLDDEAREALFEFGYDTGDPEGRKKRGREERERERVAREEAQGVEELVAGEVDEAGAQVQEEEEGEEEDVKLKARGKTKGKAQGKGKARADPQPQPDPVASGAEDAGAAGPARRAAATGGVNGRKRSAALAGLDSPAPSARTRTAARGAAAAAVADDKGGKPSVANAKGKGQDKDKKDKSKALPKGYAGVEVIERAAASPGKKEAARLEDVDPKASFKHFETGWVLPEGSRRRSSASASASGTPRTGGLALPPTPSAGEGATLAPAPPPPAASTAPKAGRKGEGRAVEPVAEEEEEEHEEGEAQGDAAGAEKDDGVKPPPAKKARTEKKPATTTSAASPKKGAAASTPKKEGGATPAPTPASGAAVDAEQIRQYERRMAELHPQIEITPKTELSEGYLVWARQPPYPFFPAEVVDPDADDTPESIRKNRPAAGSKGDDKVPVLFFDPNRSGGWIARSNLRELAESPEADALLLSRAAIAYNRRKYEHGKPRKPYAQMLEELKDAYEWASQNAENTDDEQERLAEEKAVGGKKGKGRKRKAKGTAGAARKKR
ncbi:hypothetical protein DMC30DRAFT_444324 [Rhodotorula diobovata]|uniref:Bromodomain and PHD finger-containing protein 3 n=1 Tax=Rhodotorula diobovata TaxID=5288 RepID=A0A5C5G2R8_9BASI|nr:hypothetical protein DMC30DRAFT_444324 [Rhodotorula diobovata]